MYKLFDIKNNIVKRPRFQIVDGFIFKMSIEFILRKLEI